MADRPLLPGFRFRLGIFLLGLVLLLVLSVIDMSHVEIGVEDGDKLGHFLAYVVLMFWFCFTWANTRARLTGLLLLVLLGIIIEFIQDVLPWRAFELMDILANGLGLLAGLLLGWLIPQSAMVQARNP